MITQQMIVKGLVQGVFFRKSTLHKAINLNITGYVRNLPDGNVFIVASGNKQNMEIFTAWCSQGPPRADVTDIETVILPYQHFDSFRIL